MKFKFDWISCILSATVVLPHFSLQGFLLTISGVNETLFLGAEDQLPSLSKVISVLSLRSLHEKFYNCLVILSSSMSLGLSLFIIYCELKLKSQFLIKISSLRWLTIKVLNDLLTRVWSVLFSSSLATLKFKAICTTRWNHVIFTELLHFLSSVSQWPWEVFTTSYMWVNGLREVWGCTSKTPHS